ncbi:hypothetical protein BV898_04713 [Hypsibius exemplaris]|uniref:Uncharacterized protein n=1 Tax=Hypsibius exemplaris TaxID=2072580 RepID=A0A1W0X1A8_HYPEX|nr:hypothetical protein BV898_04713 [Hypsibius exemplaris]
MCFGTEFLEWDALDRTVKVLEMVIATYITGMLCGVMLLLRDGCRVLQARIATFLTGKGNDTKGKGNNTEEKGDNTEEKGDNTEGKGDDTLQNLRRLQERVISFSEECNGVFALLHLLVMVNAVSMAFLAVRMAVMQVSQEASSAATSVGLANGTAVYTTVSPSRDATSLFYAFVFDAIRMVAIWGNIGNCVAALIVLILANLVLQSANQSVTAALETLESMYSVGNLSVESSPNWDFCWRDAEDETITLPLWLAEMSPGLIFNIAAALYAYYSFELNFFRSSQERCRGDKVPEQDAEYHLTTAPNSNGPQGTDSSSKVSSVSC